MSRSGKPWGQSQGDNSPERGKEVRIHGKKLKVGMVVPARGTRSGKLPTLGLTVAQMLA